MKCSEPVFNAAPDLPDYRDIQPGWPGVQVYRYIGIQGISCGGPVIYWLYTYIHVDTLY